MPPSSTITEDLGETVILPRALAENWGTDSGSASLSRAKPEVVAGLQPRMESETRTLLHKRLLAATTVLAVTIGLFFLQRLVLPYSNLQWLQGTVSLLLVACALWLRKYPEMTLDDLRYVELGVFGFTTIYLAVYQYAFVLQKAESGDTAFALAAIKSNVAYVFGVIMLYGMFIPNTWKRSAVVVVPMAFVPVGMMLVMQFTSGAVRQIADQVGTFEQISDHFIILVFGSLAAIIGTHTIHELRRVAFKARQLGQYRLKEKIGGGGMGEVYLAEHQLLKRPCAIKLIRAGKNTDQTALARFEREVHTTAKLSHWNTIDIFDYGRTEDGTFYYVMEYLPGMSLADLVKRYGPLSPARAVHLLRQTCQALQEAHAIGLVHRDIKPANIFSAIRGGVYDVAKLLDFGLVRPAISSQGDPNLSQEGAFTGTPLFMSPEQGTLLGPVDARSDIYSLGATAYFLVTGRAPFLGGNAVQVVLAHARDAVEPPSKLNSAIPADLEKIILQCLAKERADRFPDVKSLEQALAECSVADQWTDEDAARWWLAADGVESGETTRPSTAISKTHKVKINSNGAVSKN